jgi:pimeloyl-ACP methyl ester carboxylesterase
MKRIGTITLLFILLYSNYLAAQSPQFRIPDGCQEKFFLTSDSVRLRYLIAGKGEALVFIPGWTMTAEIWELQIEHFAKTNTVIALDPRGQGKSGAVTEGLYFEREARDVKELVDHLKLPSYYLFGWSWAGPMLYYYYKLFNSPALKGIVPVDPPLRITEAFLGRLEVRIKGLLHDRDRTFAEFVKGLFKPPISEAYLQKVRESCMLTNTTTAVTLLAIFFSYDDAEWIQILKDIKKPILFIVADGKKDAYEELSKEVKLNYVIVPGAGHTMFIDKPIEFNKIVKDFISK